MGIEGLGIREVREIDELKDNEGFKALTDLAEISRRNSLEQLSAKNEAELKKRRLENEEEMQKKLESVKVRKALLGLLELMKPLLTWEQVEQQMRSMLAKTDMSAAEQGKILRDM